MFRIDKMQIIFVDFIFCVQHRLLSDKALWALMAHDSSQAYIVLFLRNSGNSTAKVKQTEASQPTS